MLLRSEDNLFDGTLEYLENQKSVTLFSAYLKLEQLSRVNQFRNIKQIVVRWEIQDICVGASDLEIYEYCQANKIALYRNTRLHMKAFWNNENSVLYGSANVTGRGIGELGKYNYELNGIQDNMSLADCFYLNKVLQQSEYIDSALFEKINRIVSEVQSPPIKYPILDTEKKEKDLFLISQLPMFQNIDEIQTAYSNPESLSMLDKKCLLHDLCNYEIELGLPEEEMLAKLNKAFNAHPFIVSLKEEIRSYDRESMSYGRVVNWIKNNTTTVPTPRSWEVKQELIVNILFDWICYFDDHYSWGRPNYSQVIQYR